MYVCVCVCVGTHLVVDETALTPGQLSEVGVQNLTALGNLIQWQKVSYDFQYHTAEFETNVVREAVPFAINDYPFKKSTALYLNTSLWNSFFPVYLVLYNTK